jgi:hypothetical protein
MLMVNKRPEVSCRLAVQDQVSDGLQPGDKRNTAKVADIHIAAVVSNRFAALDTSDSGLGPQAIASQVPEQVLVPPLSHRRPTPTA